jgi:hypothetical protein
MRVTVSIRTREWGKDCEKLHMCSRKKKRLNEASYKSTFFFRGKDAFYCGHVKDGARSGGLVRRPSKCGDVENSIERLALHVT